jgi:hypothetical protein
MVLYKQIRRYRRRFLAMTGLTVTEFRRLLPAFTGAYAHRYCSDLTLAGRPRKRRAGGGRHGGLYPPEQRLLFILVYLKTYPLQAVMAELFGLSQPRVNYWIHRLLPVLRDALDGLGVLPVRDARRFARSQPASRNGQRLIIDGTERRRQRPKNPEKQALHYSGKKKAHTDKNLVVVNARNSRIGFLSPTYPGKVHDKRMAESAAIRYPPRTKLYKDAGFQGYEPPVKKTCQPKKKATQQGTHAKGEANQSETGKHSGEGGAWTGRCETMSQCQGCVTKHQRGRF